MKETKFIEQNKEKWLKFEQLLRLNKRNPDQLSDLFVQIMDDLSYARTNYPNRSIRVYLNNLAQQLFYNIYKNKKESRNKFLRFWKEELPAIVYHSRIELLIAFSVFILSVIIGVVSSIHDPQFASTILGESYIEMTLQNIEKGDPMGVYKTMNEVDMFLGITLNNVLVAFRTFITGIFFSLGAIIILVYNGIMVGTFQYFFVEHGLLTESFLTIWLHGTLEISSIIIAGAAGIVLGRGFVFPGTYSRLRAFQISARLGLKLLVGIVPILIFAALIESFITRYTEVPDVVKGLLILTSLAFILFYFIWYPYVKHRNGSLAEIKEKHVQSRSSDVPDVEGKIKKVNEIFHDTILIYQRVFRDYFKVLAWVCFIYCVALAYALYLPVKSGLINIDVWVFDKILFIIDYQDYPVLFFINSAFLATILYLALMTAKDYLKFSVSNIRLLSVSLIASLSINLPFFLDSVLSFLLWSATFATTLICLFIYLKHQVNISSAFGKFRALISGSTGQIFGLYSLLLFIGFIFLIFIDSPFFAFYLDFIQANFLIDESTAYFVGLTMNGLVISFGLASIIPLMIYAFSIQYYTLSEIRYAKALKEEIMNFSR